MGLRSHALLRTGPFRIDPCASFVSNADVSRIPPDLTACGHNGRPPDLVPSSLPFLRAFVHVACRTSLARPVVSLVALRTSLAYLRILVLADLTGVPQTSADYALTSLRSSDHLPWIVVRSNTAFACTLPSSKADLFETMMLSTVQNHGPCCPLRGPQ